MAKNSKKVVSGINMALLSSIAAGTVRFVSKEEGEPMLTHDPVLIEVNMGSIDPSDPAKVECRATDAGLAMVALQSNPSEKVETMTSAASNFGIITNAVPPPSKRGFGGGGAPAKYPFDALDVNQSFFVPISSEHPDPVKTLGSTVSSANLRYSEETGQTKTVTRTVRGEKNKAVVDGAGNKVKETVTVPVLRNTRKFSIRKVEKGVAYGGWTAPADGALITRVAVDQ